MENRNASVLVMKTGEHLITFLQEVYEGEGTERKGVCLLMNYPYTLELVDMGTEDKQDLQVKFSKWVPYAIDTQFKIPYDSVIAIGNPDSGLEQAYRAKIEQVEEAMQINNENYKKQQEEVQKVLSQESEETETETND